MPSGVASEKMNHVRRIGLLSLIRTNYSEIFSRMFLLDRKTTRAVLWLPEMTWSLYIPVGGYKRTENKKGTCPCESRDASPILHRPYQLSAPKANQTYMTRHACTGEVAKLNTVPFSPKSRIGGSQWAWVFGLWLRHNKTRSSHSLIAAPCVSHAHTVRGRYVNLGTSFNVVLPFF